MSDKTDKTTENMNGLKNLTMLICIVLAIIYAFTDPMKSYAFTAVAIFLGLIH